MKSKIKNGLIPCFLFIAFLAFSFNAGAQQRTVSGNVSDESGLPLPGVTIVVKGTTNGTITDPEGSYTLGNVPSDATLVYSFVGMRPQEIEVGNRTSINITMEQETIGIEEVVAIGYGTQQRREVSGSVSNISEREFNQGLTQNAVDLLKGKVAGLSNYQWKR
jgi:TonB-dependent starch-binding outer membrane protein SusC